MFSHIRTWLFFFFFFFFFSLFSHSLARSIHLEASKIGENWKEKKKKTSSCLYLGLVDSNTYTSPRKQTTTIAIAVYPISGFPVGKKDRSR